MDIFLNYGLAWIAVFAGLILSAKYIVRKMSQKAGGLQYIIKNLNLKMKKSHIAIGIIMILAGFIHGLFSSEKVLSPNWGTLCFILTILLGTSWSGRNRFKKRGIWIKYHRILSLSLVIFTVVHIIDVGGIQIFRVLSAGIGEETNLVDSIPVEQFNNNLGEVKIKNGTYTGEATGYRSGLIVSVNIKNNKIIDIQVTDHNEVNSRFYATPIKEIPSRIVDEQSLDVDTISGATFTSIGIINAVNNALSKALVSGELPVQKELPVMRGKKH